VLATVIVWGFGAGPLTGAENRRAAGLTESKGIVPAYIVTGMVSGLLGALAPVTGLIAAIEIEPSHLLPAATPEALTETPNAPAVDALVAPLKISQFPPQAVALVVAV